MTRTMRLPWRKIAGALPALALIGGGAALATTGGHPATDIVAEATPLVTVPSAPLEYQEAQAIPPLPAPPEALPTPEYQPARLPASMSAQSILHWSSAASTIVAARR